MDVRLIEKKQHYLTEMRARREWRVQRWSYAEVWLDALTDEGLLVRRRDGAHVVYWIKE